VYILEVQKKSNKNSTFQTFVS